MSNTVNTGDVGFWRYLTLVVTDAVRATRDFVESNLLINFAVAIAVFVVGFALAPSLPALGGTPAIIAALITTVAALLLAAAIAFIVNLAMSPRRLYNRLAERGRGEVTKIQGELDSERDARGKLEERYRPVREIEAKLQKLGEITSTFPGYYEWTDDSRDRAKGALEEWAAEVEKLLSDTATRYLSYFRPGIERPGIGYDTEEVYLQEWADDRRKVLEGIAQQLAGEHSKVAGA